MTFGDAQRPLLVSVRSGARTSMPGMMETVLNLGLNDATVLGLAAWTKNDRFAWDCYRRFITMFGSVVLGIKRETFDAELDAVKRRLGVASDPDVSPDELRKLTQTLKDIVSARTGAPFPQDPREQLLLAIADRLERHYKDMQDIEFTIQEGKLYLLQTRSGKRAAAAAVGVAVDLVRESVIDQHTALLRVPPRELGKIFLPVLDPKDKEQALAKGRLLARGLPAAPGGAVGHVVFNADRAVETARNGQHVILVRPETSPEDVAGMYASDGIVTARGGRTSHAAVVAVGMGKCCVVGANGIVVDEERRVFDAGGRTIREGDLISIAGDTGEVIVDAVKLIPPQLTDKVREFLDWRTGS